jgi:hypothetical protein
VVVIKRDATLMFQSDATSFTHFTLLQLTTMFKPSTKHNIQAGPSAYAEVKLNGKAGVSQGLGRYPYRLNL